MKTLALLLLCQSGGLWAVQEQKRAGRGEPEGPILALSAGASYFEVENPEIGDDYGVSIFAQILAWKPFILEASWHFFDEDAEGVDSNDVAETVDAFDLGLLMVGCGFYLGDSEKNDTTITAGAVFMGSNDFDDAVQGGAYAALTLRLQMAPHINLLLRLTGFWAEGDAQISGEDIDWITITTAGLDISF